MALPARVLPANAKLVAVVLADHMPHDAGYADLVCWPGRRRILEHIGSRSAITLERALDALEGAGVIAVTPCRRCRDQECPGGRGHVPEYRALTPDGSRDVHPNGGAPRLWGENRKRPRDVADPAGEKRPHPERETATSVDGKGHTTWPEVLEVQEEESAREADDGRAFARARAEAAGLTPSRSA